MMNSSSSRAPDSHLDYFKGSRCGFENCKSNRYYIEEGFTYCQDGHQQDIGPQTQVDEEEDFYILKGVKKHQKKEAEEKTGQRLQYGRASTELHLHCYQLILWKQCYALIHTIGLPPELESVIKDLWALRLQLLKGRLSDPEKEGEQLFTSKPEMEKSEVGKKEKRKATGGNTNSEAEDEEEEVNIKGGNVKYRGRDMPTLIESLGICYLAMILLRLPISVGDLQRWAIKERIPFIRAIRFIPRVMKNRLPLESMRALETAHPVLSPDYLFRSVQQLCLFYSHNFNIKFPTPNIPLLLFKHVKSLALPHLRPKSSLPAEISQAVQSLSTILSIPFSFPLPSSKRIATSSFPEIKLLALIIIAVKIYHPFDSLPRHPRSDADLGTLAIDWEAWCDAFAKHDARYTSEGQLGRGNEMNVREKDVMNRLTTSQLDEYLDWAERILVDPEPPSQVLPKQLLDMFPTGRLDGSSAKELSFEEETRTDQLSSEFMLEACMKSLKLRTFSPEDEEGEGERSRLGSFYKRYRNAVDLTPSARKFHEAIASLLNVSLNTLLVAVLQVERKLQVFLESELKKERESQSEDVKGEHGESHDDDDDDDEDGMDRVGEVIVESSPPHIKRGGAGSKWHGNGEGEKQSEMQIEEGGKDTSGIRAGDNNDNDDDDVDDDDDDDADADANADDNDQSTSKSPVVKSIRVKKETHSDTQRTTTK